MSIEARVTALEQDTKTSAGDVSPSGESHPNRRRWARGAAGVGTFALLLWKFKFVAGFLLTKGKLLLAGLTKGGTIFSMLLSLGVYWTAWGWKFALGLVASIYVHEMGHVAMLRRLGIAASAPMFVPGLGAFVRMKEYPKSDVENARVGLAGPWWGLGAALFCWGSSLATGWQALAAIAKFGAWINLFNLIPVWQLDGSRGFAALARTDRWLAAAAIALIWFLTSEGLLILVLIAAIGRALWGRAPEASNRRILIEYAVLVAAHTWLSTIEVVPA